VPGPLRLLGLTLATLLLSQPAQGAWQWLRGSALTDFTDSDWEIIKATAREVLNEKPDREQVNWSNPDTGNRGSIMVLATFTHEGRICRRTAMRNLTHRGREDRAAYSLCQQADGDWIFVAESALLGAPAQQNQEAPAQPAPSQP
jgi:surface antigen